MPKIINPLRGKGLRVGDSRRVQKRKTSFAPFFLGGRGAFSGGLQSRGANTIRGKEMKWQKNNKRTKWGKDDSQFRQFWETELDVIRVMGLEAVKQWPPISWWFLEQKKKEHRLRQIRYEVKVAELLNTKNIGCSYQYVFANRMIVDLAIPECGLLIEIDDPSHETQERKLRDEQKDFLVRGLGKEIIRIKYPFVNLEEKIEEICLFLKNNSYKFEVLKKGDEKITAIKEKLNRTPNNLLKPFHHPTPTKIYPIITEVCKGLPGWKNMKQSLRRAWHVCDSKERRAIVEQFLLSVNQDDRINLLTNLAPHHE